MLSSNLSLCYAIVYEDTNIKPRLANKMFVHISTQLYASVDSRVIITIARSDKFERLLILKKAVFCL